MVRPGTPTPTDVVVAPVAQFAQWHDVNGHIHPTSNSNYDIGSAEYKVRHLFLSDNSMYIGDTWIKAEGDSVKMENLLVGDLNLNNTVARMRLTEQVATGQFRKVLKIFS